ncbi:TonB-dependent receptor [Spirosoma validum]|uniref:TonB-dependent receptor n=1 Tax=Spirosoma validum TaxID=2771355 RepID=A0A927B2F5_9BACT|nr:TonB-dependent receptor [Spirosoma validum]MBD2754083.1 TonB-dependent receptor [Spirosoma validum]
MKTTLFWLSVLVWFPLVAHSQTTITGLISDKKGRPLPGASVGILGGYDGAMTADNGTFSFSTSEKGSTRVRLQMLGFQSRDTLLTLGQSGNVALNLQLSDVSVALNEVQVKSKGNDFLSKGGTLSLQALDVRAMGGSNADIANAFRTLPGVQPVTNATGLLVRGGSGDETKVFIDGMQANNFFYTGSPDVSQRGRFNPDLFEGNFFSSGGYSALYGQALSSTLILDTRNLPAQSSVNAAINSTGGTLDATHLMARQRQAISASVNYMNMSPYYQLVPQRRDFTEGPSFLDMTVNVRKQFRRQDMLKLLSSYGQNNVAFTMPNVDRANVRDYYRLQSRNVYNNLTYSSFLGRGIHLHAGFAFSLASTTYQSDTLMQIDAKSPNRALPERQVLLGSYQGRVVLRKVINPNTDIYIGAETQLTTDTYARAYAGRSRQDLVNGQYVAAFAETNLTVQERWNARLGVRLEHQSLLSGTNLSPRATVNYRLAKQEKLFVSYGQFFQTPDTQWLINRTSPNDRLQAQKATHYIVGYLRERAGSIIRLEAFYKTYNRLLRTTDTSTTGQGYAQGIEAFWRNKSLIKNGDFWLSYAYLDTKRQYLTYPVMAQPNFAARHVASAVMKKYLTGPALSVGLTYTYASGRPYYNPSQPVSEFMTDRTADYHNLGVTLAHLTRFLGSNALWVMSANNLLGSQQIFDYQYSTIDPSRRQAVTPLASRFYYVGLFLSWGIDKRQKTIDDLL